MTQLTSSSEFNPYLYSHVVNYDSTLCVRIKLIFHFAMKDVGVTEDVTPDLFHSDDLFFSFCRMTSRIPLLILTTLIFESRF